MQFSARAKMRLSQALGLITTLMLMLLLVVACGTAAPAPEQPAAPETSSTDSATDSTVAQTSPTAVPQPTTASQPSVTEVHPGKVTWLVGSWGNERFDPALAPGGDPNQYGRLMHGFLLEVSDDFQLIPGMASDWDLSNDGLTWTFTLRGGVKFHDGEDLTTEDILWTWQHYYSDAAREYSTRYLLNKPG